MPATRRVLAALAAAATCVALVACGGADAPDPADGPPAGAGTRSGLGAERFEAIDEVYVASRAIDEFQPGATPDADAFAAATQQVLDACDALDAGDPLLAALRSGCALVLQLGERLLDVGRCAGGDDARRCLAFIDRTQATIAGYVRVARRADRVVARAGLSDACEQALTTTAPVYENLEQHARGLRLLERALRNASQAGAAEAQRVLGDAGARGAALPDGGRALALFRSGCG